MIVWILVLSGTVVFHLVEISRIRAQRKSIEEDRRRLNMLASVLQGEFRATIDTSRAGEWRPYDGQN